MAWKIGNRTNKRAVGREEVGRHINDQALAPLEGQNKTSKMLSAHSDKSAVIPGGNHGNTTRSD